MNEKLNFNVFSKMDFFSKIVRIVRISSENVRIFVRICSKKFWPPCKYKNFNFQFSVNLSISVMIADTVISIVVESLFLIQVGISFIRGGKGLLLNLLPSTLPIKPSYKNKCSRNS